MKDFKKYFIIPEEPEIIYKALTNPLTLRLWTGEDAVMSTEPGSEFSIFGGDIEGRNIEFEEGRKLVQQWYFDTQDEPSIVTIILHKHKLGTSAELRHVNIPDEAYDDMAEGWVGMYFRSLIEFYE